MKINKLVFIFKIYIFFIFLTFTALGSNKFNLFIKALESVESNFNSKSIGDNGKAKGILQLHKIYVDDVNRIYHTNYNWAIDSFIKNKAEKITKLYLYHYAKRYKKIYKKNPTFFILAQIHNGGPNGFKNKNTIKYAEKVMKYLNKK